ncbi:MAG: non-heme iron oxygenase ferredoxin subunit [Alphaproteobacteria bacterium]
MSEAALTSDLVRLCSAGEVEAGGMRKVDVPGHAPLAIYNIDGQFYVTEDTCTHGQSSLAEDGTLDGFTIECSFHYGSFDVRTGKVIASPCRDPIKTYTVVIKDGAVFADLTSAA